MFRHYPQRSHIVQSETAMEYLLAHDVGTSGDKAAILTVVGRIAVFADPDGNALQLIQINWGKYYFGKCFSVRSSLPSFVLAKNRIVIERALLFAGGFCNDPPRYYA